MLTLTQFILVVFSFCLLVAGIQYIRGKWLYLMPTFAPSSRSKCELTRLGKMNGSIALLYSGLFFLTIFFPGIKSFYPGFILAAACLMVIVNRPKQVN